MKKSRVLAMLLSLMMLVCSLPVMQVSATVGDSDADIASSMGVADARVVYEQEITADYTPVDVASVSTASTYTDDGVQLDAEGTSWILEPKAEFYHPVNAVVVKAKVGADNRLTIYTEGGGRTTKTNTTTARGYVLIADKLVYARNDANALVAGKIGEEDFQVGDEWFELLFVHHDTSFDLYVKNDTSKEGCSSTNGLWKKLDYEGNLMYENGHAGTAKEHHFYLGHKVGTAGENSYVKSVKVYNENVTMESLLGVAAAKNTYNVQIDANSGSRNDVAFHEDNNYGPGSYTANGVTFASGDKATMWGVKPATNYWSVKNATVIKAKLGNSADVISLFGMSPVTGKRFNYKIAHDQVNHQGGAALTSIGWLNGDSTSAAKQRFTPGTDWFELMVVEEADHQKFYGRNEQTANVWSYLGRVNGYEEINVAMPVYAIAKSTDAASPILIQSISVYRADDGTTDPAFETETPEQPGGSGSQEPDTPDVETPVYDTIEKVLTAHLKNDMKVDVDVTMTASSNAWNFANSTMTAYTRSDNVAIVNPAGASYTQEGLNLSGTNGTDTWKFSPFRGWSPMNTSNGGNSFRAVYFKVKGTVNTIVKTPDNYSLVRLTSSPGVALSSMKALDGETSVIRSLTQDVTPDDNWIEYLMMPRNTNAVYLWAKSDTLTGGNWVRVMGLDRYYYTTSNAEDYDAVRRTGMSFSGSGVVADWKTIDYNTTDRSVIVNDAAVTPAGATVAWMEEEFDNTSTYQPEPVFGDAVTVANGILSTNVKLANEAEGIAATSGHVKFNKFYIPVGGYAEFKMKSNGLKSITMDDGVNKWAVTLNCDYSQFPGTQSEGGGFTADSDMSWRTWRIVRTANGYSTYSKADGDTGWRIHAVDGISSESAGNDAYISIQFYANADGVNNGNGQLDYMKIYGTEAFDSGDDEGGSEGGDTPGGDQPETNVIDTIAEVIQQSVASSGASKGDTVVKEKTDDLFATSHHWNFANSTMETYFRSGNGSLALPTGAELTAEGLDLSGTQGVGKWTYLPHAQWSFVNAKPGSDTAFRAGYVKVKGNVTISFTGSAHKRLINVYTKPNTATTSGLDNKATSFVPDDGWVEYLFVPYNSNNVRIWAKKVNDKVWVDYGRSGTTEEVENAANVRGLHFAGTGVVAEWKTYEFNENGYSAGYPDTKLIATTAEITPATANVLAYGAEFDVIPEKAVLAAGATVANGVLDTKATVKNDELGTVTADGTMKIAGLFIPVGGYAEFKAKGNGAMEIAFDDGTNKFYMHRLPADNYSIQGSVATPFGGFVNDSDMAWRTYRLVRTNEGYSLYSQAEGDTGWRMQAVANEANQFASDGNGAYVKFRFHTNCDGVSVGNGQMDYLRIYGTEPFDFGDDEGGGEGGDNPGGEGQEPGGDQPEPNVIDTIYEVLQEGVSKSSATQGEFVAKVKTDNLYATTHDWNFENSTMETYSRTGNGSLKMPEGAAFTAEGLDLSGTQGNGEWKYFPHASWAFVNANTGSNVTFRAGYVKVKGKVTISFTGSEHKRLIKVYTEPNVATASGLDAKATTFVPDDGWVEYIFIPKNSNSINIWAKKASDAVWTYCGTSGTTELVTDASPNRGLHFSGTGVVALWKTFEFNENGYNAGYPDKKTIATEKEATPENADTLWFSEEFDQEITYFPSPVLGAASSVANGVLDTKTTVKNDSLGTVNAEGTLQYDGLVIPVGGYAEFKAKGNGTIEVLFDDGTNQFTMHRLPADNYSIRGTAYTTFANFVNDSDMAWRTYRVVRTAEGYSFYSKAEGDTGWRIMGTAAEESKLASDGKGARIYFRFHTNCDGVSVGNGQLDYLRIYGVAPDAPLTLTDGYTTTPVAKGATLEYPDYLRIIPGKGVTEGKVIICNYDGKVLKGMKTIDVSELADGGSVNVFDEDNNTIKLFLWDSIEGMKSLSNEVLKVQY